MDKILPRLSLIVVISLIAGLVSLAATPLNSLAQDPRPTVGPPPGPEPGPVPAPGGGTQTNVSPNAKCGAVLGQVINWGAGGEGGVTTELKNGSWQLSAISATDGNYGFGGLGVGLAVLQVVLTPSQADQWQPLIQNAGVYLNCDYPTIANIALFHGSRITPPARLTMSAQPKVIAPGGRAQITLKIKNGLPNDITNVIVTDLMPAGLMTLEASSAAAKMTNIINGPDGQLAAIYFDRLAAGAEATARLTIMAAPNVSPGVKLTNTATLFYRESVADQAALELTIGGGAGAAAATSTPALTPKIAAATTPVPTPKSGEAFVPPGGLPTTGDSLLPPGLLPVTGLGALLPLSGLGLALLAGVAHYLRSVGRNRE